MPTWEPKAEMTAQLPDSVNESELCWYAYRDGRVHARIDTSEYSFDTYIFSKEGDSWVLVESVSRVTVN